MAAAIKSLAAPRGAWARRALRRAQQAVLRRWAATLLHFPPIFSVQQGRIIAPDLIRLLQLRQAGFPASAAPGPRKCCTGGRTAGSMTYYRSATSPANGRKGPILLKNSDQPEISYQMDDLKRSKNNRWYPEWISAEFFNGIGRSRPCTKDRYPKVESQTALRRSGLGKLSMRTPAYLCVRETNGHDVCRKWTKSRPKWPTQVSPVNNKGFQW